MTNPFTVNFTELDEITGRISAFEGFINDSLSGLDQRIAAMHQTWTGSAADAHRAAHAEWKSGAQEVADGISALREAATRVHENYTNALEANLRTLGRQ